MTKFFFIFKDIPVGINGIPVGINGMPVGVNGIPVGMNGLPLETLPFGLKFINV